MLTRLFIAANVLLPLVANAQPLRVTIPTPRDQKPEKVDPRCAPDGPGFIYVPASGTCLRLSGLVGVEAGRGTPGNLAR